MPNFCASSRTASGNPTFSCSSRNLKTSPPTPQPKQWKNPRSGVTWNDGVFSRMKRTEALVARARRLQRDVLLDHLEDVGLESSGRR